MMSSPSPIIHSSNTDNIMNHTPTKQQTQQTQVNLRSTRTSSVTSTASSQHQHQSSHEDANASTSSRSLLLPLPSPSRHLIDEEGGLSSLLDTKWDIALLAVAIFFAFNLVVVICCFWQRRRRQGRAIHVDDQEDARTGPAQKGKPEQLANQQLPPSKRTKKRGGAGAGGVARDGTGSGAAPKASKAHVNKYPIVPVISFAARSHLETSSSDDGQGGGDDARSIVSSMYDTTSQKWDESYFNTSHHDGNGNGRSTGANGTYNGVMKETIDGILGSRFFPYNAPTTPILPTSPSSSPRKRDLQDDGGRKISGTSGDTSTTQAESNTGLSFPASTHSFEI